MRAARFQPVIYVMLVFGFSGTLTGGLLHADVLSFERTFGLNHEELALWLGFFAVLSAMAGGVAGLLADRFGSGRIFHISLLATAVGLLLFVLPWSLASLAGYLLAGFGIGGLATGNAVSAEGDLLRPNRAINHLHAAHAAARLAAISLSIAALAVGWRASYAVLGLACLVLALRPPDWPEASRGRDDHRFEFSFGRDNLFVAAMLGALFLYMLAELVLASWLAAYFETELHWSPGLARAAYGIFLLGLLLGRFIAARRWLRTLPRPVAAAIMLIHLVVITVFFFSPPRLLVFATLFVLGLCQGPGWIAPFSLALDRLRGRVGQLTSVVYMTTCTGVVVSTAGSGIMVQRLGLESIFPVVAVTHLAFSAIYLVIARPRIDPPAPAA